MKFFKGLAALVFALSLSAYAQASTINTGFGGGSSFTSALSTTQTIAAVSTDGVLLTNTTAAAAGAQQWSPRLHLHGNGWKTNATAGSQAVDAILELVPVQGAANPTYNLVMSGQVNAAGYAALWTAPSGGGFNLNSGTYQINGTQITSAALSDVYVNVANTNFELWNAATAPAGGSTNEIFIGNGAGNPAGNSSATANIAVGFNAMGVLTGGGSNVAVGSQAFASITTDSVGVAIGWKALQSEQGSGTAANVAVGSQAGLFSVACTTCSTSVFLGRNAHGSGATTANEIVLGDSGVGLGANQTVIGNSSTTVFNEWGASINKGTKFTISGCSAGTTLGGPSAGSYVSGTTGTCTVTVTIDGASGATAPNGWSCWSNDLTTPADVQHQTATSTTTVTISGTTVTNDVVNFGCVGY